MIELHELRQFAAFAECGTLSQAAERLHLSQPALSRSMKKLEEELGIPLFARRKNRLELNENGRYLAELTHELLADADALAEKLRAFDRKNRTISLGLCAPAPGWLVSPLLSSLYPHKMLQTEIAEQSLLLPGLLQGAYQLVVLAHPPGEGPYFSRPCGSESLFFALPRGHRYARRKSLSFEDMNGENMLLMGDIGFWNFVPAEKMPASRFLVQADRFSFDELVRASSLPSFSTDLAKKYLKGEADRVEIPVSDPEATVTYHLVCRREDQRAFRVLFAAL